MRPKKRLEEPHKNKYSLHDALFSIRRCVGALALLEEHCGVSTERCRNCVEKHLQLAVAHSEEAVELEVLKAEEFGREATVIKTKSKKIAAELEKVPPKLARLASVYYAQIGSRPAQERTPAHWRKVGMCARTVRKWMQNTFNISKVAAH
jgi:hypothetical protein